MLSSGRDWRDNLLAALAEIKLAVAPESGSAESRLPFTVMTVLGVGADVIGVFLRDEVEIVIVSIRSWMGTYSISRRRVV